jgi:hypothetical protein
LFKVTLLAAVIISTGGGVGFVIKESHVATLSDLGITKTQSSRAMPLRKRGSGYWLLG